MVIIRVIKALFGGAIFFILLGLCIVVGSAIWSAVGEYKLEDGTTLVEKTKDGAQEISDAYAPIFKDVDVKEVLKQDAEELEVVGRKTVKDAKAKIKPVVDEYGPEVEARVKEVQRIIDEYNKEQNAKKDN